MSALWLAVLLAGAPDAGDQPLQPAGQDVLKALSGFRSGNSGHAGITACASCHVTASWTDVRFNHERTGFPLTGKHARASCKSCHVTDFQAPLPQACLGCHRDVHAGELGARCESCHVTADWRSRFDADAHRFTNFPLLGPHGGLPCVECHAEARERRLTRSTVDCASCHQSALSRTVTSALNHLDPANPELTQSCGQCHSPLNFTPARYVAHEQCFPILSGPHAALPCTSCHELPTRRAMKACSTRTANRCVSCHVNGASGVVGSTDEVHRDVALYSYAPRKCAECHGGSAR
ncbi:MAG: cytochrome C [Archangium sp.]